MDQVVPAGCARRFRPKARLASGGFGTVWLAEQVDLERPVALKILRSGVSEVEQVARFHREARVTARILHPNVVQVIDHDVEGGVAWIAYEFLEGEALSQTLEKGALEWTLAALIAAQVARGLDAAHAAGVLHRDVKPANVIAAGPYHYKLADFGIARWSDDSRVHTAEGVILGTPRYIAPEVIGGRPASPAADLYALAVMTYEMIAGRPPFDSPDLLTLFTMHVRDAPPKLEPPGANVPRALSELVARGLTKDPADRFASAADMADALEAVRDRQAAPPTVRNPPRPFRREGRSAPAPAGSRGRRTRLRLLLALALAAAGVLAVSMRTRVDAPSRETVRNSG